MPIQTYLTATKFTNLDGSNEQFGYRLDDRLFGSVYCDVIPEDYDLSDDFILLATALNYSAQHMADCLIKECEFGIVINGTEYTFAQVSHIFPCDISHALENMS